MYKALDRLLAFVAKYPPSALRHLSEKPRLRFMKTIFTSL